MYFASIVVAGGIPVLIFLPIMIFLEKKHSQRFPGGNRESSDSFKILIFSLLSVLSVLPSYFVQYLIIISGLRISGFLGILFNSFVASALVEELLRLIFISIAVKIVCKKRKVKNYSLVLLSAFSGLIFGSIENILYGIYSPQAIILRIFTAVVLHGVCGFLIGKYITLSLEGKQREGVFFLIFSWGGHGIYNFFIQLPYFQGNFPPFVFSFGILIFMLGFCFFSAKNLTD